MELAARPSGFQIWLLAARPRTLPAAVAPVVVGAAAAGMARPLAAVLALFSSLFIQIGTNFANDYSDFKRGADAERVGPMRVTQSGLVAPGNVKRAAWIAFGISMLFGLSLAAIAGWPIVVIGAVSIAAGWLYTGGPWPLGYHGLGDLFVLLFFGLVATCGTAWAVGGTVTREAVLAGFGIGCLATAILVVNNLRDARTDAKVGKNTLAVRLGPLWTRVEYVTLVVTAFWCAFLISPRGPWALLALPLAVPALRRVLGNEGAALNPGLGETARLELVYAALLAVELWR